MADPNAAPSRAPAEKWWGETAMRTAYGLAPLIRERGCRTGGRMCERVSISQMLDWKRLCEQRRVSSLTGNPNRTDRARILTLNFPT
jgi:hypothetical protein